MQRHYGWYASRTRGTRRRQPPDAAEAPAAIVDPVRCPQCQGLMRIVAVITDPSLIGRILAHRARARDQAHPTRSPPPRRQSPAPPAAGPPHQ